ncbi:MAG: outer membrane lipoprotein chaperone LolA [Nitrospinae bacterium]|nr:outer membrane lipoprotein chaperone LolA [Nitrospinota bacterium]
MNKTLSHLVLLALLLFPSPALPASEEQSAVDSIQKAYENTRTFRAFFVQKAYVKMMDRVQETQGEVYIKKPGKMKWVYSAPDPQVLISNNKLLWLYVPEDRQANKMPVDNVYSSNTPALFLAGKGKLTESFIVSQVVRNEDQITVVMVPKREDLNLEKMVLQADGKNYQIVGSTVYDKLGNKTEIEFNNIQVNMDLPEEMFQFKVPEGVEVMDFSPIQKNNR